MSAQPLVSLGLPVFNGETFVERAIDALCGQDYERLEIIVSDNGSTDNTPKICRAAAERDPRVVFLESQLNRGASWNFGRVFYAAHGEYFKWAACDDLIRPEFVSTCVTELEADPSAVLCYPRTSLIDEDDIPVADFTDDLALDDGSPVRRLLATLPPRRRVPPGVRHHPGRRVARHDPARTVRLRRHRHGGRAGPARPVLEHPDRLFLRRYHPGTSVIANPTRTRVPVGSRPRSGGAIRCPSLDSRPS